LPQGGGPKPLSLPGNPKPLAPPSVALAAEDDEDLLEIKQDTGAGKRAVQNMINSMLSLQNQSQPDWSKIEIRPLDEP
jgi:hypothetical protein